MADTGEIVKAQMDELRDKILWSPNALSTFLDLMKGIELSWTACLPASSSVPDEVKPFIWTAYGLVKSYLSRGVFQVEDSYFRDRVLKIAIQLSEDAEYGLEARPLSSRSKSPSSLSVSFEGIDKGSVIMALLKELDRFKQLTALHETGRY